jgi:hypothetical protein
MLTNPSCTYDLPALMLQNLRTGVEKHNHMQKRLMSGSST